MKLKSKKRGAFARSLIKLLRGAGVVVLLLVVAIPGWVMLAPGDLDDAGDGDLLASAVDRRGGGAAHRTSALLGRKLGDFDHERAQKALLAFREGDFSDAAWVEEQSGRQAPLRRAVLGFDEAIGLHSGDEADLSEKVTDDGLMGLYGLARMATAEALLLERAGRVDEALELALFGLRAGRTLASHADIDLLGMMVSGSVQGISLASVEAIVGRHPLMPEAAKRLSSEIAEARIPRDRWQQMWANEYRWARGVALTAFEHGTNPEGLVDAAGDDWASFLVRMVPNDYLMQPNRTIAYMADLYRNRRDQTGQDCVSLYAAQAREISVLDTRALLVRPNPVGNLLVLIAHPDFEKFELKRCAFEAKLALAQVVVATRAYSEAEGHLPESMDALVPRYLGEVPSNPYDGGALRYSKADRTITAGVDRLARVLGPERADVLDGHVVARSLDWGAGI